MKNELGQDCDNPTHDRGCRGGCLNPDTPSCQSCGSVFHLEGSDLCEGSVHCCENTSKACAVNGACSHYLTKSHKPVSQPVYDAGGQDITNCEDCGNANCSWGCEHVEDDADESVPECGDCERSDCVCVESVDSLGELPNTRTVYVVFDTDQRNGNAEAVCVRDSIKDVEDAVFDLDINCPVAIEFSFDRALLEGHSHIPVVRQEDGWQGLTN